MTPEQKAFIKANCDRDGIITPDDVVAAAEPETSPIHDLFLWDDQSAGHKYRLEQARAVIRTLRIEIVTTVREIRLPEYIRDPEVAAHEQGYIRTSIIRTREESIQAVLDAEVQRVESAILRGRTIAKGFEREADFESRVLALMQPEYPRRKKNKPAAAAG